MKKLTALAIGAAVIGAVAAETVNLYKQVMGRNDRFKMPVQRFAEKQFNEPDDSAELMKENIVWADGTYNERYTITSGRGEKLIGYYWPPEGGEKPEVIVIGSHGYHADHKGDPYTFIRHYHERGYGFFAPDHTGSSESEGKYVGFDYYESADLLKWINFITEKFGKETKLILHGVSMGAATVMKLCGTLCPKEVKLIIEDCGYTSAVDEFLHVAKTSGIKKPENVLKLFNALNKTLAGFDLKDTDVREEVKNAAVPMLFIHGDADDFVPTRMVYELYELCPEDKRTLKIISGATHAKAWTGGDEYYEAIDSFIDKNL